MKVKNLFRRGVLVTLCVYIYMQCVSMLEGVIQLTSPEEFQKNLFFFSFQKGRKKKENRKKKPCINSQIKLKKKIENLKANRLTLVSKVFITLLYTWTSLGMSLGR